MLECTYKLECGLYASAENSKETRTYRPGNGGGRQIRGPAKSEGRTSGHEEQTAPQKKSSFPYNLQLLK